MRGHLNLFAALCCLIGSAAPAAAFTVGDWEVEQRPGLIRAYTEARERDAGLFVECNWGKLAIRLAVGEHRVNEKPVMMKLDSGSYGDVPLGPYDFAKFVGAEKHLASVVLTKMSFAVVRVTFQVGEKLHEFSLRGFDVIWPELQKACE
jgi:hypothetical protein